MHNALQIYGELRTFLECIPSILNFIDYSNIKYDLFYSLMIKVSVKRIILAKTILKNYFKC